MDRKKEIDLLETQILVNEMLGPELRCDEFIARLKTKLTRLREPDLRLVISRPRKT
jgi:hypothetical protein